MDVERIQKINNLALDLVKQGLAANRDEAIAQAEKVFSSKDSEAYNSMKETLQEVKLEKEPESRQVETDNLDSQFEEIGLPQGKIEEILEKNTRFLVKTIKDFKEKIDYLEKELSIVKNRLNYTKLPTVKDIVSKSSEEDANLNENPKEIVAETDTQLKTETKSSNDNHPRVGNYNDSDVSIEKFFYMGSK